MLLRKKMVYFNYHLNCRKIHDNTGDKKLSLVKKSQRTLYGNFCLKFPQRDANQRDLKLCRDLKLSRMKLRKKMVYF